MTTKLCMIRDINGYNSFGLTFTDTAYSFTLDQGVRKSLTVPYCTETTYKNLLAVFSFEPGSKVWVALNNNATLPGFAVVSTHSELNPSGRLVQGGDLLSFVSGDTLTEVGVTFYAAS